MIRKSVFLLFMSVLVSVTQVNPAEATIFVDWFFLNDGATFAPPDLVLQRARIVNLSSSTENFTETNILSVSNTLFSSPFGYIGIPGPTPFFETFFLQFEGLELAPGESFDFVHSNYGFIPSGDPAPEGTYYTPNQTINFQRGDVSDIIPTSITRSFRWTVEDQAEVVPEPSSALLLGFSLAGTAFLYRRRKV